MNQATPTQTSASTATSFRVSAPRPSTSPSAMSRGSVRRAPRGSRAILVISRAAASAITANGAVESGSAPYRTSGRYTAVARPVPSASVRARPVGSPRSSATSAASRQARTGTSDATSTDDTCAAANVVPRIAIVTAARNVGSGSQTSNAGRGNTSGGV